MPHDNSRTASGVEAAATNRAVRSLVQNSSGPIGIAALFTVASALAWVLTFKGWGERQEAPNPTAVLITIIALGSWRPVRVPGFETALKHFRTARMALLAVVALVAMFGIYRWARRGVVIAIPVLAAWNLALEIWHLRHA